jgi:hypothetical protein
MKANRVTPEMVTELEPNEIFVFGSNMQGQHIGGAAKFASDNLQAQWGVHNGWTSADSYAIPTVDFEDKIEIKDIEGYVAEFIEVAKSTKDLDYLVTPIGCGIAGFTEQEVAPMFKGAVNLKNVSLPESFWNILNKE